MESRKPIKFRLVRPTIIREFPVDGMLYFDGLLAKVTYDDGSIDYVIPYVDITFDQYPDKPGTYKFRAYIDREKSYDLYDTFKIKVI